MWRLAAAFVLAMAVRAQSPSPSLQIQEQQLREARERAEQIDRAIIREQREAVEREHATERLLQRRAEAEQHVQPSEPETRRIEPSSVVTTQPVTSPTRRPGPDFSPGVMARAATAGLLAGALALVLGKVVERRFLHS